MKPGWIYAVSAVHANVLAAVAFSVDTNLGSIITCLVATVAVILAVLNFIDRRIQDKNTEFAKLMELKHEANLVRFDGLHKDMEDLKKLLVAVIGRPPRGEG